MSHFFTKFVREVAKISFGSVKAVLSQMDFIQMGFCFINKYLFSPCSEVLHLYQLDSFLILLTNVRKNKTLFVCFLFLIGD